MPDASPILLSRLLKDHFGYDSFRPQQEEIIQATMAGRDVLALLPTGGGKSLCFQLPAMAGQGLTLVVSPLIALMKDQVDQLTAAGIPATFLNSTLESMEARHRLQGLEDGRYRLLYAAPERIMLPGFLEELKRWKVERVAIDEAHCISEWGHDFRPEYRQLPTLRGVLPGVPFLALTATATDQVREDIEEHLGLRDPVRFTASFNRPNLTYRVDAKAQAYDQVRKFLEVRPDDSGIIYCQSRKTTEQLAARLTEDGIPALPYHAGLDQAVRAGNQDRFLRDGVRVVCATIAFGMGINKPNVRFVVHYDLPKNLEGYYQETGRAGRDGLPGDCLLLFSGGDVAKHLGFLREVVDPAEAARSRHLLDQVVHYSECSGCRRRVLLDYFSEEYPEENCGSCDNCLSPRVTFDGTVPAQKLLSCVLRANQASRWQFGLGHYCDILCGANTESIRRQDHQKLSTYGIGTEMKRPEWQAIGRELVRMGFLIADPARMGSLSVTEQGLTALKTRAKFVLTQPAPAGDSKRRSETPKAGNIDCDEVLFQSLRTLRRELAEVRSVPPYVIFGDVPLRHMAREYPRTAAEFSRIPGVGSRKLEDFGGGFMEVISQHVAEHGRRNFAPVMAPGPSPARPAGGTGAARESVTDTVAETLRIYRSGVKEVRMLATVRNLAETTVTNHLAKAITDSGAQGFEVEEFLDPADLPELNELFAAAGQMEALKPIKDLAGDRFSYTQLHFFRAFRLAGKI
ncbi:MAG: DNA helicase RecQ [Verrucomicrobiota bacterium]